MNDTQERALIRLMDLIDESGIDGVTQWKYERDRAKAEQQARAVEEAKLNQTRYGVRRVELQNLGGAFPSLVEIETADVTDKSIANFAKERGLNLQALIAVIEGRQQSVQSKGGAIWMSLDTPSWSASKPFVDHNEDWEFSAALAAEDEQTKAAVAEMNKTRLHADTIRQAVPTHRSYN